MAAREFLEFLYGTLSPDYCDIVLILIAQRTQMAQESRRLPWG